MQNRTYEVASEFIYIINLRVSNSQETDSYTTIPIPFSLPYSGNVNYQSGAVVNQGSNGNFWSAAANSAVRAHNLNFNGTYTWPQGTNYKTNGNSVRCVLR
ncbi:hypothetical protein IJ098_03430 [Candidatus Saccharibacteria bacterium]|nr:hypothetical protein [Candidatus Saccharibacteria bacterium]